VAGITGIIYLATKDQKWDIIELYGDQRGVLLITIVLGSIWARPWNTW
jgi:hypothetical protein